MRKRSNSSGTSSSSSPRFSRRARRPARRPSPLRPRPPNVSNARIALKRGSRGATPRQEKGACPWQAPLRVPRNLELLSAWHRISDGEYGGDDGGDQCDKPVHEHPPFSTGCPDRLSRYLTPGSIWCQYTFPKRV